MRWLSSWRERFLRQRHPANTGPIRLGYRRLYILPTRACAALAVLCLLILIGAINYQLSLAFFLTFLLAGVAHAAMLHTYAALLGLTVRLAPAEPVFAGEMARFAVRIHAEKARERLGIALLAPGTNRIEIPVSCTQGEAELPIPAKQRGWLAAPRLLIENRQPTGWFRCWSYLHFDVKTLVYPQPESLPPPLPGAGDVIDGMGRAQNGEEDFAGLRAYQVGDARRLIAWKQMARTDALLSRHFQSASGAEIVLDWSELPLPDAEARLARLCAWVLLAEQEGLRYALHLPGRQIPADHGAAHCRQCLAALALHGAHS